MDGHRYGPYQSQGAAVLRAFETATKAAKAGYEPKVVLRDAAGNESAVPIGE
jgi:hypothetical protein